MSTKLKKIDIFINRYTFIQGWMNEIVLRQFGKEEITHFSEESRQEITDLSNIIKQ